MPSPGFSLRSGSERGGSGISRLPFVTSAVLIGACLACAGEATDRSGADATEGAATEGADEDTLTVMHYRRLRQRGNGPSRGCIGAHAYARAGRTRDARAVVDDLIGLRSVPDAGFVSPSAIALGLAGLGEEEAALDWLETALEERDGWLVYLAHGWPRFEELREYPRFQEILHRVGIPQAATRATGLTDG